MHDENKGYWEPDLGTNSPSTQDLEVDIATANAWGPSNQD